MATALVRGLEEGFCSRALAQAENGQKAGSRRCADRTRPDTASAPLTGSAYLAGMVASNGIKDRQVRELRNARRRALERFRRSVRVDVFREHDREPRTPAKPASG